MLAFRASARSLDGRLDTGHYKPEFQVVIDKISTVRDAQVSTIEDFVKWIGQPSDLRDYSEDGVPILNAGDVRPLCLETTNLKRIDPALAHSKARQRLNGDEALVVRTGANCGDCASAGMSVRGLLVNSHIIPIRPRSDLVDSEYLAVFLATPHGQLLLDREMTGTAQRQISVQSLLDTRVLVPKIQLQSYIGSKVRQAEILREWARNSIRVILADYESVKLRVAREAALHTRVSGKDLRDRLDSEHYPDDVLQFFRTIEPSRAAFLQSLSDDIFSGTTLSPAEEQTSTLQATVATLGPLFLNDRLRNVVTPRDQRKRLKTHDLAIAAAAHTASYIGRDVTYCVADEQIYPSTEVLVIRPAASGVPSSWLWCFLKSQLGYRQIQACVRGITAHAYSDDICHVRVPLPEAEVADRFHSYEDTIVLANNATKLAKALTDSARFLVEALIEGKVTEAELIGAGNDADADRALLARLRDDGLDGAGSRLFPDIDALFELIEQVQRSEADS
jgi:type I restriction enzyme S subunit